ncbi:MAG TPA: hypothetical protein GX710_05485 [Clostridiales bacterium]|nr:hypothetical protein [Clostridiales bacterium]
MQISKSKAQIFIGTLLLILFIFTVDFRTSIFKSVYIAYAVVMVALFLIYRGAKVQITTRIPPLLALWIVSITWVITTLNISYIIKYVFAILLLYCFCKKKESGMYLVNGLVVVGVIFAGATFLFYFFPNIYLNSVVPKLADYLKETAVIMMRTNRYPGLTGHYSTNGTYLAIGFGAVISTIFCKAGEKKKNSKYLIVCLLILGALLLIGKRAHLVFSVAAAFGVYWLSNDKDKVNRLIKLLGIVLVAAILFVIMVNQIPALSNTFNRFSETADFGDFLMSRGLFYAEAISQFKSHLLLGCGWKQMVNLLAHDVHNIYIQLLAETGLVGFSFYIILFVSGLLMAVRLVKMAASSTSESIVDKKIIYFAAYYMFFFILYGFTGNPLYDEQPFYLLMISYGILLFYSREGLDNEESTYFDIS